MKINGEKFVACGISIHLLLLYSVAIFFYSAQIEF